MSGPNILRTSLLCLGFLVGLGGGIFLITRKRALPGWLTLAGFVLFGLSKVVEYIYTRFNPADLNTATIARWVFSCVSGFVILLGILALVAALVTAIRPQTKEPVPEEIPQEAPPPA